MLSSVGGNSVNSNQFQVAPEPVFTVTGGYFEFILYTFPYKHWVLVWEESKMFYGTRNLRCKLKMIPVSFQ